MDIDTKVPCDTSALPTTSVPPATSVPPETSVPATLPKRPWFQLHLSTAFMLMLATGSIMSVFFRQTPVKVYAFKMGRIGWPWTSVLKINAVDPYRETTAEIFDEMLSVKAGEYYVSYRPLAADVGVILLVLVVVAALFEFPIRWDKQSKAAELSKRAARRVRAAPKILAKASDSHVVN